MNTVLEIRHLTVDCPNWHRRLLDDVSLSIGPGKTLALVGESGAGKSLTSLAAMGLLPERLCRTHGSIAVNGRDIDSMTSEELRTMRNGTVSMIMQNPMSAFDAVFTIRSHFAETLAAHEPGISHDAIAARALEAMAETGLETPGALLDIYPFQMSGGMLQRVMIALALVGDPLLLIADEATTDLDVMLQSQIVALLKQRRRERNLAMLLITHDLSVAASLADDVAVMHQGVIVESGPAGQMFTAPRSDYATMLLDAHYSLYDGLFTNPGIRDVDLIAGEPYAAS